MKLLVLTKSSPFQIKFVNSLLVNGYSITVIVEDGLSFGSNNLFSKWLSRTRNIKIFLRNFTKVHLYLIKFLQNKLYYSTARHAENILINNFLHFSPSIETIYINNINNLDRLESIYSRNYDLAIVFGTRLLTSKTISKLPQTINIHWGISPKYRGEGIISSLAHEGKTGPGLTIHFLDIGIDDGDIIVQGKPNLTKQDNFYSIGLKLSMLAAEIVSELLVQIKSGDKLFGYFCPKTDSAYTSKKMMSEPDLFINAWKNLKC